MLNTRLNSKVLVCNIEFAHVSETSCVLAERSNGCHYGKKKRKKSHMFVPKKNSKEICDMQQQQKRIVQMKKYFFW